MKQEKNILHLNFFTGIFSYFMKKIIYHGEESNLFTAGTFSRYLERINCGLIGRAISHPETTGEKILHSSYFHSETGLRIDYLFNERDREGPITVIATGTGDKISLFERTVLDESEKLKKKLQS